MQMSGAFFLHFLTPADIRSPSIQANHLNFGLPAFLLPSVSPKAVLSSDVLTRWPVHSNLLTYIVVTILGYKISYAILNSKNYICGAHHLQLSLHTPCFRSKWQQADS